MIPIDVYNETPLNRSEAYLFELIKKFDTGSFETVSGILPLSLPNAMVSPMQDYKIYGNSEQEETPTKADSVEVESVGDLVTDAGNEHFGLYKIQVKVNDAITDIYLSEPLRKIGEYADYIDFANGRVVRNVAEKIFTGAEDWTKASTQTNTSRYYTSFANAVGNTNIRAVMCNYFRAVGESEALSTDTENCATSGTGNSKVFNLRVNNTDIVDKDALKEWVKDKYIEGKPLKGYAALATAENEAISLPKIGTYHGTNTVDINTDVTASAISITYKAKA